MQHCRATYVRRMRFENHFSIDDIIAANEFYVERQRTVSSTHYPTMIKIIDNITRNNMIIS